jgi:hypothetical protein
MNRKCGIPRRWIAEHVELNREIRRNFLLGSAVLHLGKVDSAFRALTRKLILEAITDPEERAMLLACLPPDIRLIK